MDPHSRDFIEVIRTDVFTRIVRVGHWFHIVDEETGVGKWEWHGPQKRMQLTKAFTYEKGFPNFPKL